MVPKMIWANLVSTDLQKTSKFYTDLGFKENDGGNSKDGVSFFFGRNNFVINFFIPERLAKDINGNLKTPQEGSEIIFSLSAETKEDVDKWFEKVKSIGGNIFAEPQKYDQGYTFGFADPDGHKFNILYWPGM